MTREDLSLAAKLLGAGAAGLNHEGCRGRGDL